MVTAGANQDWLSFTQDQIMYTDGLAIGYYSLFEFGGTAHFPLLYTMIGLTLYFFFKEYRVKYKSIDSYGKRGCESLLSLIRRLTTVTIFLPSVVKGSECKVPIYYVYLLNQVTPFLGHVVFC